MCGGLCKKGGDANTNVGSNTPEGESGPSPSGATSSIDHGGGSSGSLFESISREERELRPSVFPGYSGRRRRIRRLHSRTGFDVAVYPNGKVRGTMSPKNKYGSLEFEIAGKNGELRIKGVVTGFYITMTPKGRIVGQPRPEVNGTVWIESRVSPHSAYIAFLSRDYAHLGWYFAVKKSGKPKAGHKTNYPYPQKSISFLTYIVSEEFY